MSAMTAALAQLDDVAAEGDLTRPPRTRSSSKPCVRRTATRRVARGCPLTTALSDAVASPRATRVRVAGRRRSSDRRRSVASSAMQAAGVSCWSPFSRRPDCARLASGFDRKPARVGAYRRAVRDALAATALLASSARRGQRCLR
jgi:hypothetical protein